MADLSAALSSALVWESKTLRELLDVPMAKGSPSSLFLLNAPVVRARAMPKAVTVWAAITLFFRRMICPFAMCAASCAMID